MTKKHKDFLFFTILLMTVFIVYRGSLGLTLYGDDFLVISKFFGGYGPGKELNYYDPRIWISNYGFQYLTALLYLVFGLNSLPYYIISLTLRALLAYSIYFYTSHIFNKKAGILSGLLFAVSSVGAETTDWVYNMNSYIGIFFLLIGLTLIQQAKTGRSKLKAWVFVITGYIVVPIRLFIVPMMMPLLAAGERYILIGKKRFFKPDYLIKTSFIFILTASPFLLLRLTLPSLGWQKVNSELIGQGILRAQEMVSAGRYDFLATPFTNLGRMVVPIGPTQLQEAGLKVYPLSTFLKTGLLLFLLGSVYMVFAFTGLSFKTLSLSFLISALFLSFLKIFIRYQGEWLLKEFSYFAWTFFGLLTTMIFALLILKSFIRQNKYMLFYGVSFVFTFSFLYPWLYSPGFIFSEKDRYMILPSVGLAMFLGSLLSKMTNKSTFGVRILTFVLFLFFVVSQAVNVQRFFKQKLIERTPELNGIIFDSIMAAVPELPKDYRSVFYFEDFSPGVSESLLRFGFGYHMQLFYNFPFNEELHPVSLFTYEALEDRVTNEDIPEDYVFAFRWKDGEILDITKTIRRKLFEGSTRI